MTRLGILGGGQLAQMLTQAAISLGIETAIFERQSDSPAARLTHNQIAGAWDDQAALMKFANMCDVVTLENEFVDAAVLRRLEATGLPVYPTSTTLASVQDKFVQKTRMSDAGIPVPPFRTISSPNDVLLMAEEFGYPLVLKTRRDGYDGYGNVTVHSADDVLPAWDKLSQRPLMVEGFVRFVRELAVMVVRGHDGEMRTYPVVETVQQNHICHIVRAPAQTAEHAAEIARQAVAAIKGVGIFGVELFELPTGKILYNEIAPRPHNSGHYTIEGCVTSQFENHIRAGLGWSLGSTELVAPAAVMVNLLGKRNGTTNAEGISAALKVPGAHVHLYGKRDVRIGRKMGHITALGATLAEAEAAAQRAANLVEL